MAKRKQGGGTTDPEPKRVPLKSAAAKDKSPGADDVFKKGDFVSALAARSGLNQRDARAAADAALSVLSERLMAGDTLQLPPLGRVRVVKSRSLDDGAVVTAKIRIKTAAASPADTLEVAAEDG